MILTTLDQNSRLYQASRRIKYFKVQTSLNAIPEKRRFAAAAMRKGCKHEETAIKRERI